jgi:hypothetical protein
MSWLLLALMALAFVGAIWAVESQFRKDVADFRKRWSDK